MGIATLLTIQTSTDKTTQNSLKRQRHTLGRDYRTNGYHTYNDPATFRRRVKNIMGTDSNSVRYLVTDNNRKLFEDKEALHREHWRYIFTNKEEDELEDNNEADKRVRDFLNNNIESCLFHMQTPNGSIKKLYPLQFGFRTGRGTAHELALVTEAVAQKKADSGQCHIVLRDSTKALDKVWHWSEVQNSTY